MYDTKDKKNVKLGMTSRERTLLTSLTDSKRTIFTLGDVSSILNTARANSKVIVDRLVRKKWVVRVARGKYLIVPLGGGLNGHYTEHEFLITSNLANPYYIGYWSALNHHAFTEQVPSTVFVATARPLKMREIAGVRYRFIPLVKSKFFGFHKMSVAGGLVNISTKEKTLADCLDHPEYCGGIPEVSRALRVAEDHISFEVLVECGISMGNSAILKRLGYLIELTGIDICNGTRIKIASHLRKGYSPLDPLAPRRGRHSSKWHLLLNLPESSLLEGAGRG